VFGIARDVGNVGIAMVTFCTPATAVKLVRNDAVVGELVIDTGYVPAVEQSNQKDRYPGRPTMSKQLMPSIFCWIPNHPLVLVRLETAVLTTCLTAYLVEPSGSVIEY
jgi:hypothetical protein